MGFGALMGRVVCGFLCPFGLVQDLLYKIPVFKKRKNMPGHKVLGLLRFIVLAFFVLILPEFFKKDGGFGQPWFCEFICPSGTLLGGIPLVLADASLREIIGFRFFWKIFLLIVIFIVSTKYYRPFCKYLCPLGAMYGLFNPIAFYRMEIDKDKCTNCGACSKACKMEIDVCKNPNSPECIRCGECKTACSYGAIRNKYKPDGLIVLVVAIVLIVAGVYLGEHETVLKKAINICLECIGIG